MASRKRLTREMPARTGPIRNRAVRPRSTSPLETETGSDTPLAAAIDESLNSARRIADAAGATLKGVVELGVHNAYAVIDDYMQRGRDAAAVYQQRSYWRDDMSGYRRYGYGYGGSSGGGGGWGAPVHPMLLPWVQMMNMWMGMMPGGWGGGGYGYGSGGCATADPCAPLPCGPPPCAPVSVRVESKYPAEVTVEIHPGAECVTLKVGTLYRAGDRSVGLSGVSVETIGGSVRVHVPVEATIPPGRYCAPICDLSGNTRGSLTVNVSAPPAGYSEEK